MGGRERGGVSLGLESLVYGERQRVGGCGSQCGCPWETGSYNLQVATAADCIFLAGDC